jgi:DNA-directed RNA polymerase specialized sigma24 family protein
MTRDEIIGLLSGAHAATVRRLRKLSPRLADEAEDLSQQATLYLLSKESRLDALTNNTLTPAGVYTYHYQLAYNLMRNRWRRRRLETEINMAFQHLATDRAHHFQDAQEARHCKLMLERFIAEEPIDLQPLLDKYYFEGHGLRTLTRRATLYNRLRKAKREIDEKLQAEKSQR